ncbi:zinc transporter Zip99C isoform X2 [Ptiloglossa arizonensis]|uniref:zinc transporter Zip99C isoform X2 n=1 Tax=Ptiloglossa arizonensis TaxID=3350558 RepID=UPI003FA194B1
MLKRERIRPRGMVLLRTLFAASLAAASCQRLLCKSILVFYREILRIEPGYCMSFNSLSTVVIIFLKEKDSADTLKVLLSFAVGGLLGDVFLHLLPEAWENSLLNKATDDDHPSMTCSLWVLGGFLVFVIVEKLFSFERESETEEEESVIASKQEDRESSDTEAEVEMENNNCITLIGDNLKNGFSKRYVNMDFSKAINDPFLEKKNEYSQLPNGYKAASSKNDSVGNGVKSELMCKKFPNTLEGLSIDETNNFLKNRTKINCSFDKLSNGCTDKQNLLATDTFSDKRTASKEKSKHITGYLNLIANIIDNFTHGLAVGGSFLVSLRLGALTTFAILIHEIPHEVGDFAILLRSGFNRWDAARAQLITASGGILGAMSAVCFSGGKVGATTSWILPFTAGGFLHISMVTILPELIKESSPKESLKQVAALLFGIIVMAVLTILCD